MENLRKDWSEFLEYTKKFIVEPLTMLDIGCSGGIDPILKNFGDKIIYYGFDPNINEIAKLKSENNNPNINYIETFVDCEEKNYDSILTDFFQNTSAAEGAKIINKEIKSASPENQTKHSHDSMVSNNLWNEMSLTTNKIKITDFIKEKSINYIDFIKTDIDGLDLSFFKSIESIIEKINLLAAVAEVSFASNNNDQADLTILLKKYKFALNALSTRTYSSKYLPDLYALNISAQTISGRLTQGDAVYIKDITHYKNYTSQQLLKIAILMDLFNLTDCAAEVFILFKTKLEESGIDTKKALDLMAKQRKFSNAENYEQLIDSFYKQHESFYPKKYSLADLVYIFGENIIKIGEGSLYKTIQAAQGYLSQTALDQDKTKFKLDKKNKKSRLASNIKNIFLKIICCAKKK